MYVCVIMPKPCTYKKGKTSISYPWISQKFVVSNICHSKAEFYKPNCGKVLHAVIHLILTLKTSPWLFLLFCSLNYQLWGACQEQEGMVLFSSREITEKTKCGTTASAKYHWGAGGKYSFANIYVIKMG